ncbi:MAG: hypothetical protein FWE70_01125 [Oscillospiraceae bacterium]|nr:hypothetical protein [Oscillospiraceae bacterium]
MTFVKYLKTAQTAMRGLTNGGLAYLLPQAALSVVYLVPLMFIWRAVASDGAEAGMTLAQLLSYTYVNALLGEVMIVRTHLTAWDSAGECMALFTRPMPVFGQTIARTAGEWVPSLLAFSLPMALASPLFSINIAPRTLWVIPSLALCASLGFAIEFIFLCVTMRLRNVSWLTSVIRSAVVSFFSGTVIPFRILPFGLDRWMAYQPFGSLGGATLSVWVGSADALSVIPTQIFWNVAAWAVAAAWFRASRDRMVSYGG